MAYNETPTKGHIMFNPFAKKTNDPITAEEILAENPEYTPWEADLYAAEATKLRDEKTENQEGIWKNRLAALGFVTAVVATVVIVANHVNKKTENEEE